MIVTHMPRKCEVCNNVLGRKHHLTTKEGKITVCYKCFIISEAKEEEILSVKS